MENNIDIEDEPIKPKTSLTKNILNRILSFDIYSQPLNLTYKSKTYFKTPYGIFFSLLTIAIFTLIIVENVIFFRPNKSCQYKQMEESIFSLYKIDLNTEFFLIYSIYNKETVLYLIKIANLYQYSTEI